NVGIAESSSTFGKITVDSGGNLIASGTIAVGGNGDVAGGTGTLQINSGAFVQAGGRVKIYPSSRITNSGTLKIDPTSLVIATGTLSNTGTVDLNGKMIIEYSGATPITSIKSQIVTGYAGGAWTGSGIKSTSAAANLLPAHKTGIG